MRKVDWKRNFSQYISVHLFTLIYHLCLIQDICYLASIILNNVTNFHVHTAICFSVIYRFSGRWVGASRIDLPNMADFAIMHNLKVYDSKHLLTDCAVNAEKS